jgi:hypothetical protein
MDVFGNILKKSSEIFLSWGKSGKGEIEKKKTESCFPSSFSALQNSIRKSEIFNLKSQLSLLVTLMRCKHFFNKTSEKT